MGLLPVLIVFVLGLWQIGLVGYTYMLAGHAAQEGARMLAVNPTDGKPDDAAVQEGAPRRWTRCPKAWRQGRGGHAPGQGRSPRSRARQAHVPVVLPGPESRRSRSARAPTAVEDEELPPSQQLTPTPTPEATT